MIASIPPLTAETPTTTTVKVTFPPIVVDVHLPSLIAMHLMGCMDVMHQLQQQFLP